MTNKFNWQIFISIGLLFSFMIMFLSGVILYIAPEGSVSRWIGWDVLNLSKKQWEYQHTIFSFLFIVFSVLHIFKINWGLLIYYFAREKKKMINGKEFLIAFIISVIVFSGTLFELTPFKNIIQLSGKVAENYLVNIERPEIPDSEKLSLREFSERIFQISYEEMEIILKKNKLSFYSANITIIEFCTKNEISPQEFYNMVKDTILKSDD